MLSPACRCADRVRLTFWPRFRTPRRLSSRRPARSRWPKTVTAQPFCSTRGRCSIAPDSTRPSGRSRIGRPPRASCEAPLTGERSTCAACRATYRSPASRRLCVRRRGGSPSASWPNAPRSVYPRSSGCRARGAETCGAGRGRRGLAPRERRRRAARRARTTAVGTTPHVRSRDGPLERRRPEGALPRALERPRCARAPEAAAWRAGRPLGSTRTGRHAAARPDARRPGMRTTPLRWAP